MDEDFAARLQLFSERLVKVSVDTSSTSLETSLADLGRLTGAERVYVFLLTEDESALESAFEWCDEGVKGHDFSTFAGVPVTAFPWSMARFRNDELVFVRDASKLPAEADAERQACQALSIGAYINLPLWQDRRLLGWLGFDSDRREPPWGRDDIELMRASGRMLAFTIDRIERERRLQHEQAIARRLTGLGALAAGLGHEINNPLSFVSLNLQVLRRDLAGSEAGGRAIAILDDCLNGVHQIAEIVRSLRAFSRAKPTERVPVNVADALDATVNVIRTQLELRAKLVREVDPELWVEAGPADLGQVFANLLQNAILALPGGHAEDHTIHVSVAREDDQVAIEITDTGPGFSVDALKRLFEPFYTTRSDDAGTGIGLALCYMVVTNLGGTIGAENRPEGGARVYLRLPRVGKAREAEEDAAHESAPPSRRRVLVIDDLEPLRRAFGLALSCYEVIAVESGNAAIALLREDANWDAIICELTMPDGTGEDVYTFLRAQHPALVRRLLFMSGGSGSDKSADFLDHIDVPLLEKPIRINELVKAVEERVG